MSLEPSSDRLHIAIQSAPIDAAAVLQKSEDPTCGAAALFLGIVRNHHEGRNVLYLEYECYEPMALKVLRKIADEISNRWDARRIVLVHRTGPLQIGEIAVAVAIATPHRKDSFEACRYGIDEIKERATIWKKEFYEGGERWVENCTGCEAARIEKSRPCADHPSQPPRDHHH